MGNNKARTLRIASRVAIVGVALAAAIGCGPDPSLLSDGHGVDPRHDIDPTVANPDAHEAAPANANANHEGGAADGGGAHDAAKDALPDGHPDATATDAAPQPSAFTGASAFVP